MESNTFMKHVEKLEIHMCLKAGGLI